MMLTSDLALLEDPVYLKWVQTYAADSEALTRDFGNAWYKLTTRSMGPVSRCLGSKVPPAQVCKCAQQQVRLCPHQLMRVSMSGLGMGGIVYEARWNEHNLQLYHQQPFCDQVHGRCEDGSGSTLMLYSM